jgi:hypothetical protein
MPIVVWSVPHQAVMLTSRLVPLLPQFVAKLTSITYLHYFCSTSYHSSARRRVAALIPRIYLLASASTSSSHSYSTATIRQNMKLILALNAGSSSLKASLMEGDSKHIAHFLGERLNTKEGVLHLPGDKKVTQENMSHEQALSLVIDYLKEQSLLDNLVAIGHRVVHGGTTFTSSVKVEDSELQQIKDVSHLAPL